MYYCHDFAVILLIVYHIVKQVIIDGIGIFALCLRSDFASSGFLHSSLYLLLENLICSNFEVRSSSDAVLHLLSTISGHSMVCLYSILLSRICLYIMELIQWYLTSSFFILGWAIGFGKC